ncbi:MAG: GGDEF domain-containing protein, partial [Usitatibacter sp.]
TGLPNRLLFHDRLAQQIAQSKRNSRPFALLFLDLDKFKPVNDGLGHAAGDELLKAVASRIREQVRESDTVARFGGDEFTVILPNAGERDQAEAIAAKITAALTAPFPLAGCGRSVEIGTSLGIAVYPTDARNAHELITAADAAMYLAKQAGSSYLPHPV